MVTGLDGDALNSLPSHVVDQLHEMRRRIDRDFADPRLDYPGITFLSYREWISDSGEGTSGVQRTDLASEENQDDPVCVVGGRSFPVSLREGLPSALVAVVSALQDEVMDRLNRPWPQVITPAVVLEPVLDEEGVAVWASRDRSLRCSIGYLTSTFGAVGALR